MNHCETLLEVGAEGGSVAIYGMRTPSGWLFSEEVIDQTPELIDEEAILYRSGLLDTWDAALQRLDRYPWYRLYPLQVHPEFRDAIFEAVVSRYKADGAIGARIDDWRLLCTGNAE